MHILNALTNIPRACSTTETPHDGSVLYFNKKFSHEYQSTPILLSSFTLQNPSSLTFKTRVKRQAQKTASSVSGWHHDLLPSKTSTTAKTTLDDHASKTRRLLTYITSAPFKRTLIVLTGDSCLIPHRRCCVSQAFTAQVFKSQMSRGQL